MAPVATPFRVAAVALLLCVANAAQDVTGRHLLQIPPTQPVCNRACDCAPVAPATTCSCYTDHWTCSGRKISGQLLSPTYGGPLPYTVCVDGALRPVPGTYTRQINNNCACYVNFFTCTTVSGTVDIADPNSFQSCSPLVKVPVEVSCASVGENDPILTGFDGKKFHFNELGKWNLLSEGDGWQLDAVFTGATVVDGNEPQEKSWTSSVTVRAPNGDSITCALPAIFPNTSRPTMTAKHAATKKNIKLTPKNNIVDFEQMSGIAVMSGLDQAANPYVTGCHIMTEKMDIIVYQVSGYEQATKYPDLEGWAAPYTWLNFDINLLNRLAGPVTGVLGKTYPAEQAEARGAQAAEDQHSLRAEPRTMPVARVQGDEPALMLRRLAGEEKLTASLQGLVETKVFRR